MGIPANLANGDVNERHGNGFYEWGSIKPKNAPTLLRGEGTYMYMFEFGDDAGFTQIMGCYIQTSPGLICRQAFAKSGGVQFAEWEWVNPPMNLNTEYRTTERYMGKPVYVKVVDCGKCPGSEFKDIRFDTSGVALPIRCYGNWTYDGRSTIPFETTGSDRMVVGIIGRFIRITTGGRNFSDRTCTVTVYYTKTTD